MQFSLEMLFLIGIGNRLLVICFINTLLRISRPLVFENSLNRLVILKTNRCYQNRFSHFNRMF